MEDQTPIHQKPAPGRPKIAILGQSMYKPFGRFLLRWLVSSLGLWIAAALVRGSIDYQHRASVIIIGGLILAIINTIIKPLVVLLSLPAILFTLGLFIVVVNGFSVYLASLLYPPLEVGNFWAAILAGVIIGLVNYLLTAILEIHGNRAGNPEADE